MLPCETSRGISRQNILTNVLQLGAFCDISNLQVLFSYCNLINHEEVKMWTARLAEGGSSYYVLCQ